VVDRRGAELGGERNRTALRELVAMDPQCQAAITRGLQERPALVGRERAALQEAVGRRREALAGGQVLVGLLYT
jgi:hypothetical protein